MNQRWWSAMGGLALVLVLVAGGAAACGGGDSDEDKIKSRVQSFFNHVNKTDAKGVITDLPPDIRKGCKEDDIKKALEFVKELNLKLKEVKVKSVNGNSADVDITLVASLGEESDESTSTEKLIKVGDNWYVDNEGKSCDAFLNS